MKLFKAIHIKKKHILFAVAAIACVGVVTCVVPPAATKVSSIISAKSERKLPIYCVETDKPQVSISFDAAWGAGNYRRIKNGDYTTKFTLTSVL
jgi:hypothetical protein